MPFIRLRTGDASKKRRLHIQVAFCFRGSGAALAAIFSGGYRNRKLRASSVLKHDSHAWYASGCTITTDRFSAPGLWKRFMTGCSSAFDCQHREWKRIPVGSSHSRHIPRDSERLTRCHADPPAHCLAALIRWPIEAHARTQTGLQFLPCPVERVLLADALARAFIASNTFTPSGMCLHGTMPNVAASVLGAP
jgi:hypothetical protein